MIRRPPRSTPLYSSAASDVYKRQLLADHLISVHGLVVDVVPCSCNRRRHRRQQDEGYDMFCESARPWLRTKQHGFRGRRQTRFLLERGVARPPSMNLRAPYTHRNPLSSDVRNYTPTVPAVRFAAGHHPRRWTRHLNNRYTSPVTCVGSCLLYTSDAADE